MRFALAILAILVFVPTSALQSAEASSLNYCRIWATQIHKEGRVRDSKHMHYLGCDDGPYNSKSYNPDEGECALIARTVTLQTGLVRRPRTVARLVMQQAPYCIVFEDGTYSME